VCIVIITSGESSKQFKPIKIDNNAFKIENPQLKLEESVQNDKFSENNLGNQNPTFPIRNQQIRHFSKKIILIIYE